MTGGDAPVLVEVAELADLLGTGPAPVLADVRWTLGAPSGRREFESGHLPGAHFVDLEQELSGAPGGRGGVVPPDINRAPGRGGRHPLPPVDVFGAAMRRIGVCSDSTVVAYDAASSQAAARLWWLLTDAGQSRVRVLNGGFAAWQAAGMPVEVGPEDAVPEGDFVARPGRRPVVSAEEVLAGPPGLVDVRAPERYRGEVEPVDPVAGHIPGALNLPSTDNHDAAGRFLPAALIRQRFAAVSGEPVLYCGSGVTAAQSLLALESAGLTGRIYPGSWSEWITDPTRPVATGQEPG